MRSYTPGVRLVNHIGKKGFFGREWAPTFGIAETANIFLSLLTENEVWVGCFNFS